MGERQGLPGALTRAQIFDWLRLIRTENIGPSTFRRLINRFGSADAALDALPHIATKGGARKTPRIPAADEISAEMEALDALGGRFIGMGEEHYPPLLRHIHGPPPLIAVLGDTASLTHEAVAIVGARNASAAGFSFASQIAAGLGNAGYVIASGLARGIDTAAHHGALQSGTIAMLAGGLDHIYPAENTGLAEAIVEQGGALVSEMPMGHEPRARDFPRRNRLISGVSAGVVIVEAAKRSGSLITARMALEQNREVFAVPGSPLDPRAAGVNDLIRDGATLTRNAEDVIEVLRSGDRPPSDLFAGEPDDEEIDLSGADATDDDRARLVAALSPTPVGIDELVAATGLTAPQVQIILLELEIAGRIERSGGQRVALTG